MAGAACAKAIIDRGNAVQQTMACLNATILLRAPDTYPSEAHEAVFLAAADKFAAVVANIQADVAGEALDTAPVHHGHHPPGE